jgi:hypothetical protein
MSNEEILVCLRAEIERTDAHTERECGKLLEKIAWVLLSKEQGITFVASEQFVSSGRVDIVVIAESVQPGGSSRREAYIWEIKAPQLRLFKVITKSQAQPSSHLYCAETQLMHYCFSVANDGTLLRRWNVLPEDIKLGGVIIGNDKNLVDSKGEDEELGKQLALEAFKIREIYFYHRLNMELWTWDKVVTLAKYQLLSYQKIAGDPNTSIDLKGVADLSETITATP